MHAALRLTLASLALGACFIVHAKTTSPKQGSVASTQARYIATYFPGRMTGTPAEMLSADYLRQQFAQMGYQSDIRAFNSRYIYTTQDNHKSWHNVTGSTVIAAHEGKAPQQIVILAHLDTYAPQSDTETEKNLGGLTLQGIDDNAAGLGVMLELAGALKSVPTEYSIRFVATSGKEEGQLGAENYLKRLSPAEKKNILLAINLDSLIVGDKLVFSSGKNTPASVRKLTRDRAIALARRHGIQAASRTGISHGDAAAFDNADIPVLAIEAANIAPGKHTRAFPDGTSAHDIRLDNQQHIDQALPGRIGQRTRDMVRIMLPLVKELAKAGK